MSRTEEPTASAAPPCAAESQGVTQRSARRDAAFLLLGSGTQDLAFRLAQIALPLVVLAETGSVAATGLVAGLEGLPVLFSPWWAINARQWINTGRRLTLVAVLDSVALGIVPTAAVLDLLSIGVLATAGVLLGIGEALGGPGRSALLADVGDRLGPDRAVTMLTWQDLGRRTGMVVGPPLGAVAVAADHTVDVLYLQAASVLVAGLLSWPVTGTTLPTGRTDLRIRDALHGRPEVLAGWIMRGTNCLAWFAFPLGLAVLGAQVGDPGVLAAYGMAGYGVGSVVGTVIATRLVRRLPVLMLARWAWLGAGAAWLLVAAWTTSVGAAVGGAISGGFVVVGIAAVTASITRSSAGAARRTLLSGQAVVVSASASAGMLAGGPILAVFGVRPVLATAGLLVAAVAFVVPLVFQPNASSAARAASRSRVTVATDSSASATASSASDCSSSRSSSSVSTAAS